MSRIPDWMKEEHARMQGAFGDGGRTDDSDMVELIAAALLSLPDEHRAALDETARDIARERIQEADRYGFPLEISLALYGATCGELWVEIKRRAAGRKS